MAVEELKKTLVLGHRNPDTDSICSAICYAGFKHQLTGENYEPCRAGNVNPELRILFFDQTALRQEMIQFLRTAAAAAHGAEPEPASLENRPRFTPFMSTAPKPPAAIWRSPKASAKILANTPGTLLKCVAMINRVITK